MKEKDEERDERISNEITVDCYGDDEVDYAWYSYLEENLLFPFTASVSLKKTDGTSIQKRVKVVEFDVNSERNLRVGIVGKNAEIIHYVRILDLQDVKADEQTIQAIEDWKYWNK